MQASSWSICTELKQQSELIALSLLLGQIGAKALGLSVLTDGQVTMDGRSIGMASYSVKKRALVVSLNEHAYLLLGELCKSAGLTFPVLRAKYGIIMRERGRRIN